MDDEATYRWIFGVAAGAAVACVLLIILYYARTRRSFVQDWQKPGLFGATDTGGTVSDLAPDQDSAAGPREA